MSSTTHGGRGGDGVQHVLPHAHARTRHVVECRPQRTPLCNHQWPPLARRGTKSQSTSRRSFTWGGSSVKPATRCTDMRRDVPPDCSGASQNLRRATLQRYMTIRSTGEAPGHCLHTAGVSGSQGPRQRCIFYLFFRTVVSRRSRNPNAGGRERASRVQMKERIMARSFFR